MEPLDSPAPALPEFRKIREDALRGGALDPMGLRYRILEYDRSGGGLIGIRAGDVGFREAIEKTRAWIETNSGSHFCIEPIAFLQ